MEISDQIIELQKKLSAELEKETKDETAIGLLQKELGALEEMQIPFTVSARTARLIGQENFANAEGAIIELVKNSYDAEASICVIIIDPINDSIAILDNGDGMTEKTIREKWMTIGTDDKKINYKSKTRVKTGAKGIGRFALDRLGKSSIMVTKAIDTNGILWDVKWNQFDKKDAVISDVKATIQTKDISFKERLTAIYDLAATKDDFTEQWIDEKGTLITVEGLNDAWDEKAVLSLYSNLEILVPPLETSIFKIFVFSTLEPDKYGQVLPTLCEDYDYKITAEVKDNQDVKVIVFRNELNVNDLRRTGFFTKLKLNAPQYAEPVFVDGKFEVDTSLEKLVAGFKEVDVNDNLGKIGPFNFSFYFMKRGGGQEKDEEVGKYPYKSVNYSARSLWLDKFGGIKIFRDNFRVRPYGEAKSSSFDWLDLGKRALSNPTVTRPGYRVRPQQVYGIVNISRIGNINFEDKSSREGLQENDVFTLFKEILKSIVELFENDRNQVMMSLKKIYDENNKKRKAQEDADRLLKEKKDKKKNKKKTDEEEQQESDTLVAAIEGYKEDIEELIEEQKLLRVLASAGLIVTSFAHEFRNHADSILPRTEELKSVLIQVIDLVKLKALPDFFDPYVMLSDMRNQDERLKSWLDFSISSVRKDKRSRRVINMVRYIEQLERLWNPLLSRRKTTLKIDKGNFLEVNFTGHEIDLDGIFNNLITNSVDAFKRQDSGDNREIKLSFSFDPVKGIGAVYEDTGPGLSEEIADPNQIFQPFFTTKRDDKTGEKIGTGLGMWIVKSTIDEYSGDVEIVSSRPHFKIKINLPSH